MKLPVRIHPFESTQSAVVSPNCEMRINFWNGNIWTLDGVPQWVC